MCFKFLGQHVGQLSLRGYMGGAYDLTIQYLFDEMMSNFNMINLPVLKLILGYIHSQT